MILLYFILKKTICLPFLICLKPPQSWRIISDSPSAFTDGNHYLCNSSIEADLHTKYINNITETQQLKHVQENTILKNPFY